jgi:hypothetical protein
MIYFVSYVLGLAKRGRENSENAISDDQCSAFIATQLPFTTEKFTAQK